MTTTAKNEPSNELELQSMIDLSPINTMMGNVDGKLLYMNQASMDTLKTLEQYLPSPVEKLVGQSIDIFHKNPSHQRNIISEAKNLPHRATIQLGPEKLDLLISPIKDKSGKYVGPMVTWEIITEKLKLEEDMARTKQMVDLSPMNTMMADLDGNLLYMNDSSMKTLKTLEQYLPSPVDQLVGQSIDIFHKNPSHQRNIIGAAKNLPHRAIIQLGPEKLDLLVSPVSSATGEYIGPMVTWEIVTEKIRLEEETARTKQMVDLSPMNTMMADVDGNLLYMNESSTKTLKTLEQYLPSPVDQLVGQSIDIFHKNPSHQRNIIGSSSNLPHRAIIQLGPEKLDLLVSPITSASGEYIGPMVTWEVVTEKLRLEEETARSLQMVEKSPINTMMASPDGTLLYLNDQSKTVLKSLAQYLPVPVDQLLGNSIDVFHKNPSMQRNLISDPANMPHRAIIQLGPEKLDLLLSAVFDNNQNYLGPMVNWSVVTDKVQLVADLTGSSEELTNASEALQEIANSLSAGAEETSAQANTASAASEEVNAGVQTVASNMEEMTAAIKEITKTTNESSTVSNNAMSMAQNTNTIISKLGDSSMDIGNVIKVISSIAQQTNLLALNATIEAARAGEAGKGFAVVASEVKELAKQTAKATEEITAKIENIQTDSKGAVGAIEEISTAIEKINSYAGNIAASVEEQAATTGEVSRIVTESAEGVKQINENISQVSEAASVTGKNAMSAQEAAGKLKNLSELLKGYIERLEV
ncbi:MAG: methyl-accepting chemotaxis protein [Bacteriovoracaceae bacterium]|jgi:methyl-accepting chemotaxis protein